jgi:serine/threonine protein kinase
MDWCLGSLRELLNERRRLPLKEATDILGHILDGLAYAYGQDQVLHLDVKPANILFKFDLHRAARGSKDPVRTSRFMISDWIIASIKQPQLNEIAGMPPSSKTAMRTLNNIGTLAYMAPERFCRGFHSSVASDIFSTGIVYLEMLTGALPFRNGVHPVDLLLSGQYFKDAEALMLNASVPRSIRKLVLHMIEPHVKNRPPPYSDLCASATKACRDVNSIFAKIFD